MREKPISPLRHRMIEDMTVLGFVEKTQSDYIRHVKNFTIFLGRAPDTADGEDLRAYQVHQRATGVHRKVDHVPTLSSLRRRSQARSIEWYSWHLSTLTP